MTSSHGKLGLMRGFRAQNGNISTVIHLVLLKILCPPLADHIDRIAVIPLASRFKLSITKSSRTTLVVDFCSSSASRL